MNFYPTVYIDAWKNDHLQDPLLNVVGEIRSYLIAKTDKAVLDSRLIKSTWRHFIRTWYSRNPLLREYFTKKPYAMLYEGDEREDIHLQLQAVIADGFHMKLRTVDLWLDRLAVAIAATQKNRIFLCLHF